jgi:hypothetical protein
VIGFFAVENEEIEIECGNGFLFALDNGKKGLLLKLVV